MEANWIKCSERLPKTREVVQIYPPVFGQPISWAFRGWDADETEIGWIHDDRWLPPELVTHWMPLPAAPAPADAKGGE